MPVGPNKEGWFQKRPIPANAPRKAPKLKRGERKRGVEPTFSGPPAGVNEEHEEQRPKTRTNNRRTRSKSSKNPPVKDRDAKIRISRIIRKRKSK